MINIQYHLILLFVITSVSDKIRRGNNEEFTLSSRINIARILSLTHRQFTAPRFKNFLKYSWYAAGYLNDKPEQFLTPVQYCFDNYEFGARCACNRVCFLRCAFCERLLCFEHCLLQKHTCINEG